MRMGRRVAAVAVFAASIGLGASGVAWGGSLDSAVPVRRPDVVQPMPPGFPQNGPIGCDDWAEPYENNVPQWGTDPYNQFDNWCDGPEDGLSAQQPPVNDQQGRTVNP
nr:hypothetical protein [Rhodococcus wratislaviensis]